jgi:xanthine/CO dehydrogenase XdhC/CoxF family maturation factor
MVRNGAVVERYSTTFDDTAEIPFGLGCGGIVDLLLEPANTSECSALITAIAAALRGISSTVVTWLPGEGRPLRRAIFSDDKLVFATDRLDEKKLACGQRLHLAEASELLEGRFVERLRGPQRLFVLGAGDDARPLVTMAALLGWAVTVLDGRTQLARPERFPQAASVVSGTLDDLSINTQDAVVLMTHSYEQDREMLAALLPIAPRYLGLLGARHRSALLVAESAALANIAVEDACARLYAPVGLDLGGDGPEAIALAIISEAQAVCQGRLGASRRLTAEDISHLNADGSASRYLQTACSRESQP